MSKLILNNDQIHLWLVDEGDFDFKELQDTCINWLPADELTRYRRFQLAQRRKEYLLGTMLIRTVLSEYAELLPGQWQFSKNEYGKPAPQIGLVQPDIFFNLSHSGDKLVLAVSRHPDIGVDIERSNRPRRVEKIAGRYFSEAEIAALLKLGKEDQLDRFYELWTLKESYIKARGMGLALPLQRFGFHLDEETAINFHADPELNDEPQAWRFWQLLSEDDYKLALAIKPEGEPDPMQVDAFQKLNLSDFRALELGFLRQT